MARISKLGLIELIKSLDWGQNEGYNIFLHTPVFERSKYFLFGST